MRSPARASPAPRSCTAACRPAGPEAGALRPRPPCPAHPVDWCCSTTRTGTGRRSHRERRVPDVEVEIAGRTGRSAKVTGRHGGARRAGRVATACRLRSTTLPPFYRLSGSPPSVAVAPGRPPAAVALTLAIGNNRPNLYLGFGDSITVGDGSRDIDGYRDVLQEALQRHFGRGSVEADGLGGTQERRRASSGIGRPAQPRASRLHADPVRDERLEARLRRSAVPHGATPCAPMIGVVEGGEQPARHRHHPAREPGRQPARAQRVGRRG